MGIDEQFALYGDFTAEEKMAIMKYQVSFWQKQAKTGMDERKILDDLMEEMIREKDDFEKALEGAMALEKRNKRIFDRAINLLEITIQHLESGTKNLFLRDQIQEFVDNQKDKTLEKEGEGSKKGGGRREDDNREPIII